MTIPQHTSLDNALGQLRSMNADIASVGDMVTALIDPVLADLDAAAGGSVGFTELGDYDATLQQARDVRARAAELCGPHGFSIYCRLRAQAVADAIALALADDLGFPPEANRTTFIGAVLRAWVASRPAWQSADPQALDDALSPLDVPFRLRRANFVLTGINELLPSATDARRDDLLALKSRTWDLLVALRA